MSDFSEKLRLKEQAEENLYFARRDRELVAALRQQRHAALSRLRSGGQTGVDRGALDAALAAAAQTGLCVDGWCPRGRLAEDGAIAARYPLTETPSADPAQRTRWNVRDADGTLILSRGTLTGGTAATADEAAQQGKPLLLVDPTTADAIGQIRAWIEAEGIRHLNVAGPRESEAPGIAEQTRRLLARLLLPEVGVATGDGGDDAG